MIVVSDVRCSDCLAEFSMQGGRRFGVIKEDTSQTYSPEMREASGHLYQVLVCAECAGWYEDAVELEAGA